MISAKASSPASSPACCRRLRSPPDANSDRRRKKQRSPRGKEKKHGDKIWKWMSVYHISKQYTQSKREECPSETRLPRKGEKMLQCEPGTAAPPTRAPASPAGTATARRPAGDHNTSNYCMLARSSSGGWAFVIANKQREFGFPGNSCVAGAQMDQYIRRGGG